MAVNRTTVICTLLVCCLALLQATPLTDSNQRNVFLSRIERAVSSSASDQRLCRSNPCAWEAYRQIGSYYRETEFFMKNTCRCEEGLECLESEDDVRNSATVFRCQTP